MLTAEENHLLTRTGPGTPCGDLLRRYWQPVALVEELPPGGAPLPVTVMGEELVLFRDEQGRPGLLGLHCSHRGADLSYGRLEDGGLRCIYHGWLYDIDGRCLEQPGEPAFRWTDRGGRDSMRSSSLVAESEARGGFAEKIKHRAYPCQEAGDAIFAYLGPGQPPLLPNYEVLTAPADRRYATKYFLECNYLQALEGNEDTTHLYFLHRSRSLAPWRYVHDNVEETDFGVWHNGENRPYFILPSFALTGKGMGQGDGYMLYWRVPIDDTHHWQFIFECKVSRPFSPEERTSGAYQVGPDYHPRRNKANRYLQDREEQRTATFTGMGYDFPAQDACANEGSGPIQDRTYEHLGQADNVILAARKVMMRAIKMVAEGEDPPGLIRDPAVNTVDPLFLKQNRSPLEQPPAISGKFWGNPQVPTTEIAVRWEEPVGAGEPK